MTRRAPAWIAAACAAALFVPLVIPLATGRVFTMDDLSLLHLPSRMQYARALAAGDSVLWTPAFDSGYYLHGEGQSGMYHPLHRLLYGTLPFAAAFNLELVASYAFAWAGTLVLLRRWGFTPAAALVGALAFAFSGFNLFRHLHLNLVAVGAHLPWLLWLTDVVLTRGTARVRLAASIGFAAALGSAFLIGFPQMVLICAIAVGTFVVWRVSHTREVSGIVWLGAAAAAGALVGAVQLLPTFDVLNASVRRDPSLAFRLSYSLHPLNLLQLVTPFVFRHRTYFSPAENAVHEFVVYNGAFCTLALGWAIARGRRLQAPTAVRWAIALAALAIVLALGAHGGLYPIVASWPGFRWFRAPARLVFLLHFALAVVAAAVFDDLARAARERGHAAATIVVAGLALAGSVVAFGAWAVDSTGPIRATASAVIMIATGALMTLASRSWRLAVAALPVVLALDLGIWGYGYAWKGTPSTISQVAALAERPASGAAGDLVHSTDDPNLPVLNGYRAFEAYVGLNPARTLDPADLLAQRVAGVAWRRVGSDLNFLKPDASLRRLRSDPTGGWVRVVDPMPRARLVTEAIVSVDPARDLPSIAIERTALVDAPVPLDPGPPGSADVAVDRPGRIVVDVSSAGRALLVTTERHHPGWRAHSGTRELPVVRAYGDFLACVVDPGHARVTLGFEPRSFALGARISAVTLLVLAIGGVYCLTYFFRAFGPTSAP